MASFGNRLLPKGKTLGTVLFLIKLPIEWYKFHSHSANCTEVTVLCLQRYIVAEISAYAFSVHFLNNCVWILRVKLWLQNMVEAFISASAAIYTVL